MPKPSVATAVKAVKAAPAAVEKAPKAPKEPKPLSERSQKRNALLAQKITVLFHENPGREGTKAFQARALYKTGQTVQQYLEAGGDAGYVRFDAAKGNIKLS